jgi:hypothetical protein
MLITGLSYFILKSDESASDRCARADYNDIYTVGNVLCITLQLHVQVPLDQTSITVLKKAFDEILLSFHCF